VRSDFAAYSADSEHSAPKSNWSVRAPDFVTRNSSEFPVSGSVAEKQASIAAKDRPSGYGLQLLGQDARLFGLVYDLRDQASFKVLPIDDAYQARTLERPLQPNDPTWIAARKLRYDTYCKECGFLNAADYPDGLESDLFDSVASQIVCENAAGHIVGNVRLVHFSGLGLPIQRQATSLGKKFAGIPKETTIEISRLIIARGSRRDRQAKGASGVMLKVLQELYTESRRLGATHLVAAMEPALARMLNVLGIEFVELGPPVEYFGKVVPYVAELAHFLDKCAKQSPELFAFFQIYVL